MDLSSAPCTQDPRTWGALDVPANVPVAVEGCIRCGRQDACLSRTVRMQHPVDVHTLYGMVIGGLYGAELSRELRRRRKAAA